MNRLYVDRPVLISFLRRLDSSYNGPGSLYLVGDTIQVYTGWREWTKRMEFTAILSSDNRAGFDTIVNELRQELQVNLVEESPGDVIPLPAGYEDRARPVENGFNGSLKLYYFDPYSISFRLIARGDEPDYKAILTFLEHGWVTVEEMNRLLAELLPSFTSDTIDQDPAEFRRKYRRVMQMWQAKQPTA